MGSFCKYKKLRRYDSIDDGSTWTATTYYDKGDLMQEYSEDCGVVKTSRWVTYENDNVFKYGCLYALEHKEESYDGELWFETDQTRIGEVISCQTASCDNAVLIPVDDSSEECDIKDTYSAVCRSSIELRDCVKTCSSDAFRYNKCIKCVYGSEVTQVNDHAFDECSNLANVIFPKLKVTKLYSFRGTAIRDIFFPNATSLGDGTFCGCSSLENVFIPQVTSLGQGVFEDCSSLSSIELPNVLTSIGNYAFKGTNIEKLVIPDNVTNVGGGIFYGCKNIKEVTFGKSVATIGGDTFVGTENPIKVIFKNENIGDYAFINRYYSDTRFGNPNIANVVFENVKTIGNSAFKTVFAEGLESETTTISSVTWNDSLESIGESAFWGVLNLNQSLVLPNSVSYIGNYAFQKCSSSGVLRLPKNNDLTIGDAAFAYSNFTKIEIPYGLRKIPYMCFFSCGNIEYVIVPDSTTEIGAYAFYGDNIQYLEIGENVSSIGCGEIKANIIKVKSKTPPTPFGSSIHTSIINGNCVALDLKAQKIYVPCDSVDAYKNSADWSPYADIIEGYGGSCGDAGRWVGTTGFLCVGTDKYSEAMKQVWDEENLEWKDTTVYKGNFLVYKDNKECGWTMPSTLKVHMRISDTDVTTIECDDTNIISSGEVYSSAAAREITIGECVNAIGANSFGSFATSEKHISFEFKSATPPILGSNALGNAEYIKYIKVPIGCSETYKNAWDGTSYADLVTEQ